MTSEAGVPDVVAVGEALVDLFAGQAGVALKDVETWIRKPGGSPANVAVGVARLGGHAALVGVHSDDPLGEYLRECLTRDRVDLRWYRRSPGSKTGLAFIAADGYTFYREGAADLLLDQRDLHRELFRRARVTHLGTNALLLGPAQETALAIAEEVRAGGRVVSFDPNPRADAWRSHAQLLELSRALCAKADVVKLAEEELGLALGILDLDVAFEHLRELGVLLPIITMGERGVAFEWGGKRVRVPAVQVSTVDTTGAGDAFMAGLLFGLTRLCPDVAIFTRMGVGEIRELVAFACQVASRAVTQTGAMTALPRYDQMTPVLPEKLRQG